MSREDLPGKNLSMSNYILPEECSSVLGIEKDRTNFETTNVSKT